MESLESETNSTTKQYTGKFVDAIFVYTRNLFQVNEECFIREHFLDDSINILDIVHFMFRLYS